MQDFQYDYRGMGEWLRGPECYAIVAATTERARLLYQSIVAHRSGHLAESARVEMGRGDNSRHIGQLIVGGDEAVYGLSHEFGNQYEGAADDLVRVLGSL